jgi:predicted acylesterase/phospholipase RssA
MNHAGTRRAFLGASTALVSAAAFAPADARLRNGAPRPPPDRVVSHALVLSGGGARGAYEAGLICALAARAGIADGQPLLPYELMCGTSIGAINAWFAATGQYGALRKAWGSLAHENVFEIKHPYAALLHPHQFLPERLYAALRLITGITTHELGIARSEPILRWMAKHMDPQRPVLSPLAWVATNLTTQTAEYFYRLPPSFAGRIPPRIERALRLTLGKDVVIREASDAILHRALLASAAIPLLFNPVVLPMADGSNGDYVDGSIASDAVVEIARTIAKKIHVVLVDAPSRRATYANAVAVAVGGYATMQREILEVAMRDVYQQSQLNRSLHGLDLAMTIEYRTTSSEVRSILRDLPIVELAFVWPRSELPATLTAFQDQRQLDQTFAIGERDASIGFTPYEWETFRL